MYSIWLLPSEKESKRFQKIIDTLSESFKTPVFEPHLTLYTSIPVLSDELFYKISVLAALTSVFDLSIVQLQTSSHYFKSLFSTIENNKTLQELQKEIENLFPNIEYNFQPHLSLLYGEVEDNLKNEKIESIQEKLINVFQVNRIAIVANQGEPNNWKIIETFDFHQTEDSHLEFVFETVKNLKV
ncbi:MAG: 2'-5' RNA ligase family protein [Saprospiraceae bacterium]